MQTNPSIPNATEFSPAPLRHRLRLELNASLPEVWALVGSHVRMPEFSGGISAVEIENAPDGSRTRTCQFRSPDGASPGPRLREQIRWEAPNLGYAVTGEPGNAFGLDDSLELVTVASTPAGTLVSWEEYYDNQDLDAARASFDEGLGDIARRLLDRFGGRLLERYTDAKP
jgi:hypothetical protein